LEKCGVNVVDVRVTRETWPADRGTDECD
jgi:hypothetical protein